VKVLSRIPHGTTVARIRGRILQSRCASRS
jgi:hypothetical protein